MPAPLDVRPASDEEWDVAWRSSRQATVFHSRGWAEAWCKSRTGARTDSRFVRFADSTTAVLPLVVERRAGGLIEVRRSAAAGYGGWLASAELTRDQARNAATFMRTELGSLVWTANPFEPRGLEIARSIGEASDTLVLDLRDGFAAVRGRWSEGHRRNATNAARNGVQTRRALGIGDWKAYFDVYEDSLRRWGARASSRYGWSLFAELASLPEAELWVAEHDRTVIAGALCLRDPERVIYWHGATLERAFDLRPANLVLQAAIADACERGAGVFDLGASGGHAGVQEFKRRFGATPLPGAVVRVDRGLVRVARVTRALLRR